MATPALSSQKRGAITCHCLANPHRSAVTPLLSPRSVRSLPSPCLCLSHPPARRDSPLVFYLRHAAGFQNSKCYRSAQHGSSGKGSCCAVAWCQLVPQNDLMTVQQLRVYGKAQQNVSTKVHCPQPVSPFLLVNGAAKWYLPGLLSPEGPCHLYQMHSKKGNFFLPV